MKYEGEAEKAVSKQCRGDKGVIYISGYLKVIFLYSVFIRTFVWFTQHRLPVKPERWHNKKAAFHCLGPSV